MPHSEPQSPHDLGALMARVWSADLALALDRERLAYLSGIHGFLTLGAEPVLTEEQLRDIFSLLNDIAQGETGTLGLRATHAIDALCRQQLLVRADLGGVAAEGEFTLSPLGKTLAEWLGSREGLDREGLEVMLTRIRGDLAEVRAAALAGGDAAHWRTRVCAPLKLTVAGLIDMIDRRQRGMDLQQQETREQIGRLLEARWFEAIGQCEALLQSTSETLHELNRALMSETEGVANLLNEVHELADAAGQEGALEAVGHVRTQIERVAAWGESRFHAWSAYYRNVHEFIRTIVRVDRDRALRARLRDAVKAHAERPWALCCAAQAPYRHLRETDSRLTARTVTRPRREHDGELTEALARTGLLERLAESLRAELARTGRLDLVDTLRGLLPGHTDEELFLLAGELVVWMLGQGEPLPLAGRDWAAVGSRLELQNLVVEA